MVMNNILKSNVKKRKFRLPLSAWLSYLLLTTLLFSAVSLAKYTALCVCVCVHTPQPVGESEDNW